MIKKTVMIAAAAALVMTGAFVVFGDAGQVAACDGKAKTASASACDGKNKSASTASACTRSASAAKVAAASAGGSGCTRTKTASAACTKSAAHSACCAKSAQQAHYAQVKKVADNIPDRLNSRVVVTGVYVCGSCDLGKIDKCQAFLKTAGGQLYPMTHSKSVKEMHRLHKSGSNDFEITARVTKEGGAKYLDVTYFDAL